MSSLKFHGGNYEAIDHEPREEKSEKWQAFIYEFQL